MLNRRLRQAVSLLQIQPTAHTRSIGVATPPGFRDYRPSSLSGTTMMILYSIWLHWSADAWAWESIAKDFFCHFKEGTDHTGSAPSGFWIFYLAYGYLYVTIVSLCWKLYYCRMSTAYFKFSNRLQVGLSKRYINVWGIAGKDFIPLKHLSQWNR